MRFYFWILMIMCLMSYFQDDFPYPIKEISLYLKKKMLENKLNNLRASIGEKKNKLNKLAQNNKISCKYGSFQVDISCILLILPPLK